MIDKLMLLVEPGTEFLGPYINQKTKIQARCGHGHVRYIIPSNLVSRGQGAKCKECLGILANNKYTTEAVNKLVSPYKLEGEYLGSLIKHNYRCEHGHLILGKTLQQIRENYRCKECFPQRSDIRTQQEFDAILAENNLTPLTEYRGAKTSVEVRCAAGHSYTIIPSNFTSHGTGKICRQCNPQTSKIQDEIYSFVFKKVPTAQQNNREMLEGLEIDIYIPHLKFGIEVNGDYWHSDKFKTRDYHVNKIKAAESKGIHLMLIKEHDWENKQEIIKQMILTRLQGSLVLGARQCTIAKLDYFPKEFLEVNHLQGAGAPTKHNYGLFYRGELVSVMTFSKPRFTESYEYELVRFCTLTGVQVSGGASRLLQMFIKESGSRSIITYAKRDYQRGNLYTKLGFLLKGTTVPGYVYYKDRKIYTRYQCQKHLLEKLLPEHYSPELSESEIMSSAGFHKVYDAGNLVYTLP